MKVKLQANWHYKMLTTQYHLSVKSLTYMKKKEGKMKKNEELNRTVSNMNERLEELENKIDRQ